MKKYDLKNMKVNDVTPLRARRMFDAIKEKLYIDYVGMKMVCRLRIIGLKIRGGSLFGVCFVTYINWISKFLRW